MKDTQHIITEKMLDTIRNICEDTSNLKRNLLTESDEKTPDAIAITNSARFGQNVLQSQEEAFKNAVNSGAIFSSENENDPTSNPLVFINKNDELNRPANMIFSGIIPSLNNLKFQFKLNEASGNGCFIWTDGLPLTEENMKTLNKLYGYYLNWKDQWNKDIDSLISMFSK